MFLECSMRAYEFISNPEEVGLEEGKKATVAAALGFLSLAALGKMYHDGGETLKRFQNASTAQSSASDQTMDPHKSKPQAIHAKPKKIVLSTADLDKTMRMISTPAAKTLISVAHKEGIYGIELLQFVAQCGHETDGFTSFKEYGGRLDFAKYERGIAAKILGNLHLGDGAKYHGRGYIQLTGRDNYKRAGLALNLPLEKHPELAEKPEVAAKIAVWFWKTHVKPNVKDFNNVQAVTKPINRGLHGLQDREIKFAALKQLVYKR